MDARHPFSEGQAPPDSFVSDRLDSWKAIAQFLKRDVRTVQRWETREGLPVYRHQHSKRGSIYAYRSEIDAWWKARQPGRRERHFLRRNPRQFARLSWPPSYPQMAIFALLLIGAAFSIARAKQMFLNWHGASQTAPLSQPVVIAVLPFNAAAATSEDANAAVKITDALAQDCRLVPGLRVVNQSDVLSLRNAGDTPQRIARLLHSDKLLRGTAGRSGNSIRITAELIDGSTGNAVWSKTFEQSSADPFQAERNIASTITTDIVRMLAAGPPPDA